MASEPGCALQEVAHNATRRGRVSGAHHGPRRDLCAEVPRGLKSALQLLAISVVALPTFAEPVGEYQVKAAFLLNFTKFVEWRTPAAQPQAPITLCVLGDDPFGTTLDRMVEGETAGNRPILVQRIREPGEASCNLAFVSKSEKDVSKALAQFGPGVLTVGEGDEFLKQGGMIAFVVDNRRVRFDVNQAAVHNASLRVSSRLMTVARSVKE